MQGKRWLTWLVATLLVSGCGRTSRNCQLCGDGEAGEGGTSNGGASFGGTSVGGSVSAGTSFGGGVAAAGAPAAFCTYGYGTPQPPTFVSYSPIDLGNTMNDVVGDGPGFPPAYDDRADAGSARSVSGPFISHLFTAATGHVEAASLKGAPLVPCAADTQDESTCINGWIRERGLRLYRRPLMDEQVLGYAAAFSQQLVSGTPEAAAKNLLLSMLLSPYFVYRIELGAGASRALTIAPPGIPLPQPPPSYPLSAYEIAARLSHFAWRSAPDAQLLATAAAGKLSRTEEVLAAFDRLLADPRSVPARTQEVLEWLDLEHWGTLSPDMPSDANRLEQEQTSRFIADVLANRNGSLTELLSSPRQPLNDALAQELGIAEKLDASFKMVELDPTFYAGIFGQPAWLRHNPHPSQRGVRISSEFLCQEVPPPPNVQPPLGPGNTPRERITSATANPACAACHSIFDPAGFALEAFDDQARLTGFDTSGALRIPSSGNMVAVAGPPDLGKTLADQPDSKACAALHALEYLLQTKQFGGDLQPLVTCVTSSQAGGDLSLNELARQIATSAAMLQTLRPPSSAVGVGKSADPIQHAIEETQGLVATLPPEDAQALRPYEAALSELLGLPPPK